MQLDSKLIFAWQQAVTAAAASAINTTVPPYAQGVVDIGIARNIGVGTEKLYLVVACTTAMTDGGSDSTITPSLRTSATIAGALGTNPSLNGTVNTLLTLPAFAAVSPAGTLLVAPLPPATYLQYLDVYLTPGNGNLTTGSFSAFICSDVDLQTYYASGFNAN